jgi:hypothetical protein
MGPRFRKRGNFDAKSALPNRDYASTGLLNEECIA